METHNRINQASGIPAPTNTDNKWKNTFIGPKHVTKISLYKLCIFHVPILIICWMFQGHVPFMSIRFLGFLVCLITLVFLWRWGLLTQWTLAQVQGASFIRPLPVQTFPAWLNLLGVELPLFSSGGGQGLQPASPQKGTCNMCQEKKTKKANKSL